MPSYFISIILSLFFFITPIAAFEPHIVVKIHNVGQGNLVSLAFHNTTNDASGKSVSTVEYMLVDAGSDGFNDALKVEEFMKNNIDEIIANKALTKKTPDVINEEQLPEGPLVGKKRERISNDKINKQMPLNKLKKRDNIKMSFPAEEYLEEIAPQTNGNIHFKTIVITHPDKDHFNKIDNLFQTHKNVTVDNIILGGSPKFYVQGRKNLALWLKKMKAKNKNLKIFFPAISLKPFEMEATITNLKNYVRLPQVFSDPDHWPDLKIRFMNEETEVNENFDVYMKKNTHQENEHNDEGQSVPTHDLMKDDEGQSVPAHDLMKDDEGQSVPAHDLMKDDEGQSVPAHDPMKDDEGQTNLDPNFINPVKQKYTQDFIDAINFNALSEKDKIFKIYFLSINPTYPQNNSDDESAKNDESLVMKVSCGKKSIILTGDATGITTYTIQQNYSSANQNRQRLATAVNDNNFLKSNLLLAAHHGSITHGSNNKSWLKEVSPSYILISNGFNYGTKNSDGNKYFNEYFGGTKVAKYHVITKGVGIGQQKGYDHHVVKYTNRRVFTTTTSGVITATLYPNELEIATKVDGNIHVESNKENIINSNDSTDKENIAMPHIDIPSKVHSIR